MAMRVLPSDQVEVERVWVARVREVFAGGHLEAVCFGVGFSGVLPFVPVVLCEERSVVVGVLPPEVGRFAE